MSWTAPRTWVTSEVISAALMNTHIRDNLLETAPGKATAAGDLFYATGANAIARLPALLLTADQTWTASATFVDVTGYSWTIGASDYWMFWGAFEMTATTNPLRFQWTFPASVTLNFSFIESGNSRNASGATAGIHNWSQGLNPATANIGVKDPQLAWVMGFLYGGGTGGTVQMQGAQTVAAGAATLKKGSFLRPIRVA